ncbi:MAG: NADPH-dependent 7-cyano-7-deazaguanine reductase QueF [Spongiibacteraceae bacterium]
MSDKTDMSDKSDAKSVLEHSSLGQSVDYDAGYDPDLLFAIPRAPGRQQLGLSGELPFDGCDIWNAYELSWLHPSGKPAVAWAELRVPALSPNIVESKSLKLYLNSLNQMRFDSAEAVAAAIRRDVSACVVADVEVHVRLPALWSAFPIEEPAGDCLDELDITVAAYTPCPELLQLVSGPVSDQVSDQLVTRRWFSRLLRSRCPVTGQPDWGTICIDYRGREIDPAGLLAYIVSFRQHQDFHEHCVERVFCDIHQQCAPDALTVSARYLRRGGIDINPWRSTEPVLASNPRLFQQ